MHTYCPYKEFQVSMGKMNTVLISNRFKKKHSEAQHMIRLAPHGFSFQMSLNPLTEVGNVNTAPHKLILLLYNNNRWQTGYSMIPVSAQTFH